nr:retrovirus-related Pol polyprotein from transposon TNT 1-94 [Tanacetum cinerariifolium]
MAACSRDRPPMPAPRRYPQWRSWFLRYVDTRPNGKALRKCILSGPYKPTTMFVHAVEATDDSPAVPEHTTVEMPTNMSPENKAHFLTEKEAIHLILTGIRDDINSTVDACQTLQEMWEAIKRLQQGESLNIQDVKTNLFWEFGKFTSRDEESMESYYTRFCKLMNEMIKNNFTVTTMQVNVQFLQQLQPEWPRFVSIVKQQHKLDEVSYHKLFDILKQYQNEVNEIRAKKLARNTNPLALVATAQASQDQYYQTSRSYRSSAPSPKPSIISRSHTTTRHKGKEIAKLITPLSETASKEDSNPEQAQRDKDMQKNLALIAKYFKKIYKPTNNNLRTSSNTKNKNVDITPRYKNDDHSGQFRTQRMINVAAARENVGSKYDWLADTDEEVDEQKLEAHYSYMAKIQEVPTADSSTNSEPVEQKANTTLAQELKECKAILVETSKSLGESISVRDSCLVALQTKQVEFEKYKAFNDRTVDYDQLERKLNEALGKSAHKDTVIREGLKTKGYEISMVITDLKLREEHDIEKMLSMEKQLKFLNEIVYKRSQSIQTIHMMAPKVSTYNGRHTFANPRYIKQAQSEISCLYAFPYDQSTYANRLITDGEETLALERESRSKLNKDLVRPYDYTKLNSLYEIFKLPTQEYETQLAHANEIRKKMWQKYFVKSKPNIYKNVGFLPVSKSISKSRQAYNVMTNNINHFKQIVDNALIKHSKYLFRALTSHDMEILIQTCLMPLAIKTESDSLKFVHELKQEMHADLKYVESLKKEIDELESKKAEFSDMYDVILQECVSKDVMFSYLQSLSDLDALAKLQCMYLHKVKECNCLAQRLSKQTESVSKKVHTELLQRFAKVEKHSISLEISLQNCKEQVKNDTVCNEKASNVFRKEREQHFEIQDLKAQIQDKNIAISELKKLIEKGKGKSVDTKVLYENTNKAWKWWIERQIPSGYKWVPKMKKQWVPKEKMQWVPKATNDHVQRRIAQLILFIVDSGCTKHMTGNLKLLCNFVEKFLGTVHFGNDQFAPILRYGDLVQGNVTINKVYYVDGLNHSLFSVGQFCDADLKVAFRKSTCFVRDLQGNDLLTGNRRSDLYTISLQESTSSTLLCLMAKAIPTQPWLWHRRLSHHSFDYINFLSKKDIMIGLPKLKFVKDQLCSSYKLSKAKISSFKSKVVPSSKGRLNLLHMDLCGPMRVASINGKKYILVIVDDYSRYTWTLFLRSKDETLEVLKDFLMMIQRNLQALVITVRTNRGTPFLNKTLNAFFKEEGIVHQTSTARTPKQNDVVERQNHKIKEKGDQCILVGYSIQSKGYRVYNKRTRMIFESIHIYFNEIKEVSETSVANNTSGLIPQRQKASDYDNPDPVPQRQDVYSLADADVPSQQELDLLFGPLYDEFFNAGSNPSTNIQSTSAPSTHTNVHAEENNNDQAEEGE